MNQPDRRQADGARDAFKRDVAHLRGRSSDGIREAAAQAPNVLIDARGEAGMDKEAARLAAINDRKDDALMDKDTGYHLIAILGTSDTYPADMNATDLFERVAQFGKAKKTTDIPYYKIPETRRSEIFVLPNNHPQLTFILFLTALAPLSEWTTGSDDALSGCWNLSQAELNSERSLKWMNVEVVPVPDSILR